MKKVSAPLNKRPLKRGCFSQDLDLPFAPADYRQALLAWYRRNDRPLPWRILWAKHQDPYHIWVSEIMLQQTVIKAVIPVYLRFLEEFPTVKALAEALEEDVRRAVRGLGYYRRFRFLHEAAKELAKAGWQWPMNATAWKALPGIGDYTAHAISSIAFQEPVAVVDGNVERVLCRLLDLQVAPNEPGLKPQLKRLAQEFLDPSQPGDFNQAMMELGQLCCTVSSPDCPHCPLALGCLARKRGTQSLAPKPKERSASIPVTLRLGIIKDQNRIALVERPPKARFLKKSLGFLTGIEVEDQSFKWDGAPHENSPCETMLNHGEPLKKQAKHTITHHKIIIQVLPIGGHALPRDLSVRWVETEKVEEMLLANLDRKAWRLFLKESRDSL